MPSFCFLLRPEILRVELYRLELWLDADFRLRQLGLHEHCRDRLRWPSLGDQETAVAVKLDRGGFDDVGILPQTGVASVQGDCGRIVRGHGGGSDVNWRSGSQQRSVGLLL